MSSAKPIKSIVFTLCAAVAMSAFLALIAQTADAAKKLPVVTKVSPMEVAVGEELTLTGKNFIKGKKALTVVFQRTGSKRRFTVRVTPTSKTKAKVTIPNLTSDLLLETPSRALLPNDNIYRIRVLTRVGSSKSPTPLGKSPRISKSKGGGAAADVTPLGDCDLDGLPNGTDPDDDNDLLEDTIENQIRTELCNPDTDGDGPTDYYEYRVAVEFNGGLPAVLPFPGLQPRPNPLFGGDATEDFDGDFLKQIEEFKTWQYTKSMDRFYSDADQDSDNDGLRDGWEDEDNDRMPNLVEITAYKSDGNYLDWLNPDSDGDTLCDGLDDLDHDGPPTPLSLADCSSPVPNNGPGGTPPTSTGSGDPNPSLIDADDNIYSNWYEWYSTPGYPQFELPGGVYDPCLPDPDNHYCPNKSPNVP